MKEGTKIKNLNISNSAIQVFKSCKRRFKYKYIDRLKTDTKISSKNLSFGNSIHSAIAQFNYIKGDEYRSQDVLQNLLRKNWIRDGYTSVDEERNYGLKGLKMLENYYNNPLDTGKDTKFIETMIYKSLDNNMMLCGKIDKTYIREDGFTEVLDYKTSENITKCENPHENPQLLMYILLAKEKLGYYPQAISFYYLSKNVKFVHNVEEKDIVVANDYISDIIHQITSEQIYGASPTVCCKSSCEYYQFCEAGQDMSEIIMHELELCKTNNVISNIF